jgi:hypothetical protein
VVIPVVDDLIINKERAMPKYTPGMFLTSEPSSYGERSRPASVNNNNKNLPAEFDTCMARISTILDGLVALKAAAKAKAAKDHADFRDLVWRLGVR